MKLSERPVKTGKEEIIKTINTEKGLMLLGIILEDIEDDLYNVTREIKGDDNSFEVVIGEWASGHAITKEQAQQVIDQIYTKQKKDNKILKIMHDYFDDKYFKYDEIEIKIKNDLGYNSFLYRDELTIFDEVGENIVDIDLVETKDNEWKAKAIMAVKKEWRDY